MKIRRTAAAVTMCIAVLALAAPEAGYAQAESAPAGTAGNAPATAGNPPATTGNAPVTAGSATAPTANATTAAKEDAMSAAVVTEGMPAPDFKMVSDRGDTVSLASLRGHRVVLYFYPKDMTPGCTAEACSFRDLAAEMKAQNAVVLGVSPDALDSHQKFVSEQHLNFPLLVDEGGRVAQAYGVWKERSAGGRTWTGNERSTFLIDENGVIRKVWRGVKVQGHDAEVLAALKAEPTHAKATRG